MKKKVIKRNEKVIKKEEQKKGFVYWTPRIMSIIFLLVDAHEH